MQKTRLAPTLIFLGLIVVAAVIFTPRLTLSDDPYHYAKEAVAQALRDPGSAQFRKLTREEIGNTWELVCGEVNGKNAFGGYVGFRPFKAMRNLRDDPADTYTIPMEDRLVGNSWRIVFKYC